MFNWIKNLFTSSPAPVAEYPKILPKPIVEVPVVEVETKVKTATKAAQKPKATAKPKAAATKKAVPKTASKKPVAIKAEPAKRGRKPKSAAGA
jgi:hypothetical protein